MNPNSGPQKDNIIKSHWSQKTFWLGNLHQIRMFLPSRVVNVLNAQAPKWSFTSRDCSTDCNLGVKHPVPGPGSYELSPSENAAKTLGDFVREVVAEIQLVDQLLIEIHRNPTSEIEKMAVKRWISLPSSL